MSQRNQIKEDECVLKFTFTFKGLSWHESSKKTKHKIHNNNNMNLTLRMIL